MSIKFGIVGAGQIAHSCCSQIADHANAEVVAASDPNAERLADLKDKNELSRTYQSNTDLFADTDVEAVYIAVPNKFHAPLAIEALNAGKHVILDKPFALNLQEANDVAAAAKKSGKFFTLGMNQRFTPGVQTVRNMVKNGELGEVYHAKAYWFRRTGIPKFGTWFGQKEFAGGGALLDIGVHLLDAALFTLDNFEPESVSGATYTKFGNRGLGEGGWGMSTPSEHIFDVDDFACSLIKLKGGQTLTLDVSWAIHQADANKMDVQLFGTEAGATCYGAEKFGYGENDGEYSVTQQVKQQLIYDHGNRFHNFINAILGEEELCASMEQLLAVQKILDGIYESCRTGKETRIN